MDSNALSKTKQKPWSITDFSLERPTTQDHDSCQSGCSSLEAEFMHGHEREWNHESTEHGQEDAHDGVVEFGGIIVTGFKLKRSVVTCDGTSHGNQDFPKWRMDVELRGVGRGMRGGGEVW